MDNKRKNRLAEEQSAYLLQHATNPVDWVPWDEDYFTSAKRDNKLIIVSIGYTAPLEAAVNPNLCDHGFIRMRPACTSRIEERPDIDHVY